MTHSLKIFAKIIHTRIVSKIRKCLINLALEKKKILISRLKTKPVNKGWTHFTLSVGY